VRMNVSLGGPRMRVYVFVLSCGWMIRLKLNSPTVESFSSSPPYSSGSLKVLSLYIVTKSTGLERLKGNCCCCLRLSRIVVGVCVYVPKYGVGPLLGGG
jgi:hypothetical protein